MPHLNFGWQTSLSVAAMLGGVALVVLLGARGRSRGTWVGTAIAQIAVMVGLYGSWQLVGAHTQKQAAGAMYRGQLIWDWERRLHVVDEAWLQSLMLPYGWLTQAANGYYLYGHFNTLIATLAWVWWRHRDAYLRTCVVLVVFTSTSTLLQLLSVAPPRLLPSGVVVDTPMRYGQSVYGPHQMGSSSQLSAMPSIHVGWSLLIAYVVVTLSRHRWRWLVLLHPACMSVVVGVTGNHYWADGAVAALILVASIMAVDGASRLLTRLRDAPTVATGVPAPLAAG